MISLTGWGQILHVGPIGYRSTELGTCRNTVVTKLSTSRVTFGLGLVLGQFADKPTRDQ